MGLGIDGTAQFRHSPRYAEIPITGALVNERLEFDVVCPNNHNKAVTFTQEEFEDTLKSGALVFRCNTCDTNWSPTKEEIAKFRKQFANTES